MVQCFLRQVCRVALLPDLGVHEKTEPEGLQLPEDESFGTVEEAKPEEVAVDKQSKRTHEQRHVVVFLAEISFALGGIAAGVGFEAA